MDDRECGDERTDGDRGHGWLLRCGDAEPVSATLCGGRGAEPAVSVDYQLALPRSGATLPRPVEIAI